MDDKRRDWELLRQFVDTNSQAAFADLTRRYLGLVHGTALRELGDRTLAEDVTQAVFLILARKARTFRPSIVLAAWLFDTCKLTARNARRDERRRAIRERKIAMEMRQNQDAQPHAAEINDLTLNEALSALPIADRQAVLLRFVCGYTFSETGMAAGVSEEAARKRVERALEKMRHILSKAGLGLSAIAAAELLQAQSAEAASAALETKVANLVFSHSTATLAGVSAHTIAQGVLKSMTLMNLKIAAAVTCGLVLAGGTAYRGITNARRQISNATGYWGGVQVATVGSSGVPGTESQARELFKQHVQAYNLYMATSYRYNAIDTYSFTETGTYAQIGNPRVKSVDYPYTMRFTFKRPAQYEIHITRNGKTSRILYQDAKVFIIPGNAPANYKTEDPAIYKVKGIDKIYWPLLYALDNAAGVKENILEAFFLFKTLDQSKRGSKAPFLLGPASAIGQVPVDSLILKRSDVQGNMYALNIEIGHNDRLIRRVTEQIQSPGKPVESNTVTYSNIQVNQPIPPETFRFTPPSGN